MKPSDAINHLLIIVFFAVLFSVGWQIGEWILTWR